MGQIITNRQPVKSPIEYPHSTLVSLSKARAAVRNLLEQVDHPVARHVLVSVADQISDAMIQVVIVEAERIEFEDTPIKGV